jgi:myo-inositol-1(or 4)-monophosphatase
VRSFVDTLLNLTETLCQVVRPELGKLSSRSIHGVAASGDMSFSIDMLAEKALLNYLEEHHLPFAYYSEDRGLVKRVPHPEFILIVDPIDGTRSAAAGFESACVSVALAKTKENSRLEDILFEDIVIGCIQEIKTGTRFVAESGRGTLIWTAEPWKPVPPILSSNEDLNRLFWSFEVAGRPARSLIEKLAPLINRSGVSGGCFIFNSSTYSITRLLTGQLDAVIDIGERVIREIPASRRELSEDGLSGMVGLFPYDLAAAYLIALEAGCCLTDAYGKDLGSRRLLGDPEQTRLSCIAAANQPLHEKLVQFVEEAFKQKSEVRNQNPTSGF